MDEDTVPKTAGVKSPPEFDSLRIRLVKLTHGAREPFPYSREPWSIGQSV